MVPEWLKARVSPAVCGPRACATMPDMSTLAGCFVGRHN